MSVDRHASAPQSSLSRFDFLPLLTLILLSSLFFFSYFNRFAGIRSGAGEWSGGIALLSDVLPYRDYYTAGPPLNQIKSAIELSLFGKTLLVSRACAVAERLGLAVLLYCWLRRFFNSFPSLLGALVTIVVSAGDRSDPLASYNHDAILCATLCGFAGSHVLRDISSKQMALYSLLAGAGAGLSALTKQTVGLGVAAAVLVLVAAALIRLRSRALRLWLPLYVLGFTVPLITVGAWLHHLGVLSAAGRMLFVTGPSAKASGPGSFVMRALSIGWDNAVWVGLGALGCVLSFPAVRRGLRGSLDAPPSKRAPIYVLLCGVVLFAASEVLSSLGVPAVWNFSKSAVYFTCFDLSLFAVALIAQGYRANTPLVERERAWELLLFLGVGWSVAITLALSWPAFEAMTLPGLALLLAAAAQGVRKGKFALYAIFAVLFCFQLREKLDLPFTFGSQDEMPVRLATQRSDLPLLRGLRLPGESVSFLDDTAHLIASHTQPDDGIFTYPEMGVFYPLTGRQPPTWAGSHNIDVVPDTFAKEEAARLLARPPVVLVYARPTEEHLVAEEKLWRNGRRSGQRDLVGALDSLLGQYDLRGTYVLKPGDDPIRVYLRRH